MRRLVVGLAAALALGACGTDDPGTRANPMPVGEVLEIGSWEVQVGATIPDAADLVLATDQTNQGAPAAGRQYAMVPIRVTYGGGAVGRPWFDLSYSFMDEDGVLYGPDDENLCGEIPGAMVYMGEMLPGESRTGNFCVSVPAGKVEGGTWFVKPAGAHPGWTGHFAVSDTGPDTPGSQADPSPVDTDVPAGPYWVAFGQTDLDAAASLETTAAAGRRLLLSPVDVTREGEAAGVTDDPGQDLQILFVSADGETFGERPEGQCGEIPEPLADIDFLDFEETVTANVCVSVPSEVVEGGTWHVGLTSEGLGWTGFVSLGD